MCGAAAAPDSSRCEHCGVRLATVACPSCFGMIFQGARFCSHCGAGVDRTEADPTSRKFCPHCKINTEAVTVGSTSLRECPRCEGIWVDKTSFDSLCKDREQQSALLGAAFSLPDNAISKNDLAVRYHPCPVCGALMNRVNFAKCSGVIVDVCREHGTWFDRDELRRIVEFIRSGGFDKARMIEIEELKRQRQQLETARTASAMNAPSGGWNHSVGWPGHNYCLLEIGVSAAVDALFDLFSGHR